MSAKYSDTFGPVLRQLRNRRDFTQERLGEMAETTSAFISMLESGHKYPNLKCFLSWPMPWESDLVFFWMKWKSGWGNVPQDDEISCSRGMAKKYAQCA